MNGAVAFVVKGYPRLSETFIAQEILALERRGLDVRLFSLRRPADRAVHPAHREISALPAYLPEYLYREPLRVFKAWRAIRRRPGYETARNIWLKDLARDLTPNRVRRFGQALALANELPAGTGWIHAHFLHTPASVARYAAIILGLPWSCSAHARDIWTSPEWEKREKLKDCRWLVTCAQANADHLTALAPDPKRVELIYHGLDFSRFPAPPKLRPDRDGGDENDPAVILSVGRAVEKKGYRDLLEALAELPAGLHWRFVHVGDGPLLSGLKRQGQRLGIDGRVSWMGAMPQQQVLEQYRAADLFALACRRADDGDRDGLPNVLMEAQSQGLPCLSTDAGAAAELIADGETGLLAPSRDIDALAGALERLIIDPPLRRRLGAAGLERVRREFSIENGIDRLAAKFGIRA
ncbi:MAG: colanic acid biosynthesis glycosyltransferase WcaL [Rhodospirillales bacterium RIFCSPLOWO2_12_FULL_58_28]|nr:MAG: colanic acid biosynthesis glycosyltransferase WcaL [Rhodospirillales bacterium RIFCSPLOWO2_02_FULL_58_16]OHC76916.1 MAG: colanic acid biosynthesis glycosyltransferase WcaL [Rhodospirillales bacterium RIFCSPLOWO2_12_FULL_58_28]